MFLFNGAQPGLYGQLAYTATDAWTAPASTDLSAGRRYRTEAAPGRQRTQTKARAVIQSATANRWRAPGLSSLVVAAISESSDPAYLSGSTTGNKHHRSALED